VDDLEVAVLERGPWRRTFRRISDSEVADVLADGEPPELTAASASSAGEEAQSGSASEDEAGDASAGAT
jgi:hypothetical protein